MTVTCDRVGLDYFEQAPFRFEATEEIAASPDEIFAVFLDATSWTRWVFAITGVSWTSPLPLEVGSTRTVSMRGGLVGYEEFIAWKPEERMAFRFNEISKGNIAAFAEDYQVTELGGGRCRVEWVMAMTPRGSHRSLAIARPFMAVFVRRTLRNFRRYVESRPQLEETP